MTLKTLTTVTTTIVSSVVLLAGCTSTPTTGAHADGVADTAIVGTSATLVVHGMSCPLCANNVDKQLLTVQGVQSVSVDMGTGEVVVEIDPQAGVTTSQLAKAVDDSGFTLAEVRSQ